MLQSMNPNQQLADVVVDVIEENKRIENNKNYSNTKTLSHQNNTFVTSSHLAVISRHTKSNDRPALLRVRKKYDDLHELLKDLSSKLSEG